MDLPGIPEYAFSLWEQCIKSSWPTKTIPITIGILLDRFTVVCSMPEDNKLESIGIENREPPNFKLNCQFPNKVD